MDKIQEIASTLIETAAPAQVSIKIMSPVEDTSNKKKNGKLHYKSLVKFKGIAEAQVSRIAAFHLKSSAKYKDGFLYFDADSKSDAVKRVKEANANLLEALQKPLNKNKPSAKKTVKKYTLPDALKTYTSIYTSYTNSLQKELSKVGRIVQGLLKEAGSSAKISIDKSKVEIGDGAIDFYIQCTRIEKGITLGKKNNTKNITIGGPDRSNRIIVTLKA